MSLPEWFKIKIPQGGIVKKVSKILKENRLFSVCEEAKCPNRFECFSKKRATFLVLGNKCTRRCSFCNVEYSGKPCGDFSEEPKKIAKIVRELRLKHVVITMVTRDDLPDGGANHLIKIIRTIKRKSPDSSIEVLTSDFGGEIRSVVKLLREDIRVFNHNLETVQRISEKIRHRANFNRSLKILSCASILSKNRFFIKSGFMVGLGESVSEVFETLDSLKRNGCQIVTIGQYLQPNPRCITVKEFINPEVFKLYEEYGNQIGIEKMYCGPLVRSSYNAGEILYSSPSVR